MIVLHNRPWIALAVSSVVLLCAHYGMAEKPTVPGAEGPTAEGEVSGSGENPDSPDHSEDPLSSDFLGPGQAAPQSSARLPYRPAGSRFVKQADLRTAPGVPGPNLPGRRTLHRLIQRDDCLMSVVVRPAHPIRRHAPPPPPAD